MTDATQGGVPAAGTKRYQIPLPTGFDPDDDDAGTVQDWLTQQGVRVAWVAVTKDGLVVEAASDPTSALTSYTPRGNARQQLKGRLKQLDVAKGDEATLRTAIGLLMQLALGEDAPSGVGQSSVVTP